ncbi:MAG: inositol phosphorylceramide synthase [Sphingobacteriales bacterium]|nr:MAG: inositol phosphorylceramide synthase [Sphingobacteriales bacterium]
MYKFCRQILIPNFKFNKVHIGDLYTLEKRVFGIDYQGARITWNEYWELHRNAFLDVMNGLFYLCWMPVPIAFAGYLFTKNRKAAIEFCLTFLLTNFVGFIGYYGYPAAPPWYVHYHGLAFNPATPGNVAGLAGFDNFFGVSIFHGLYAKSSNVFAAMPSLHAAYVVVSVSYAFRKHVAVGWKIFLVTVMLGTWFAAIYTNHHYIFDVLVGILCALIGVSLFQGVLMRIRGFRRFVDGYHNQVK